jgi:hypothetical protein
MQGGYRVGLAIYRTMEDLEACNKQTDVTMPLYDVPVRCQCMHAEFFFFVNRACRIYVGDARLHAKEFPTQLASPTYVQTDQSCKLFPLSVVEPPTLETWPGFGLPTAPPTRAIGELDVAGPIDQGTPWQPL